MSVPPQPQLCDRLDTHSGQENGMAVYLVDTARNKIGELMGRDGSRYLLRPVGGGREWACDPGDARAATLAEKLSAGVRAANQRSGERLR
ncbi:hypothetical protein [Streptomyces barkulensis]|uniref:hypothetical protein n=1 Tax=Streptomyces barkulensis TaxID=1257026 RepID=UPI001F0DDC48|nr:hypothetical protein [Streptomyces barkulensis]